MEHKSETLIQAHGLEWTFLTIHFSVFSPRKQDQQIFHFRAPYKDLRKKHTFTFYSINKMHIFTLLFNSAVVLFTGLLFFQRLAANVHSFLICVHFPPILS